MSLFFLTQCYLLWDGFFYVHTRIRFRFFFLRQLLHPYNFIHSAKEGGLYRFLFTFGILAFFLMTNFMVFSPYWNGISFPWIAAIFPFLLLKSKTEENIFILEQKSFLRFLKTRFSFFDEKPDSFFSKNEVFIPTSSDYPLLRWTKGFKGEKAWSYENRPSKPNVIFLFLESFRAKEVNGVHKPTPYFDRLTDEGIYFSQFYSNGVLTVEGVISSLFGILPEYRPKNMNSYVSYPLIGIPKLLKDHGYETTYMHNSYISMDRQQTFFQNHGFDHLFGRKEMEKAFSDIGFTSWGVHDEYLMRFAIDWMKNPNKQPFFLTLFTISNHHPWQPIPGFKVPSFSVSKDSSYHRYLSTLYYTDKQLEFFIEEMRKNSELNDTLIFILGDHGSAMGEYQIESNLEYIYEENIRTTLLILGNGIESPCKIDDPCSQIDLLPTLMDLLNLKGIQHSMGRSLVRKETKNVFICNPFGSGQYGLRSDRYKYIYNTKTQKEELYDLSTDSEERNDLSYGSSLTQKFRVETKDVFSTVNHMYQKKKFAPIDLKCSQMRIQKGNDWGKEIRFAYSLDLSHNLSISDEDILQVAKKGKRLTSLDLSHCTGITDRSLLSIAKHRPSLKYLHLSHCHTLSEKGIQHLLKQCKNLDDFRLQGFSTPLSKDAFEGAISRPLVIDLCETEITPKGLSYFSECLEKTISLGLNCQELTDEDLLPLIEKTSRLVLLKLDNGTLLTDASLFLFNRKKSSLEYSNLEQFSESFGKSHPYFKKIISHMHLIVSCATNYKLLEVIRPPYLFILRDLKSFFKRKFLQNYRNYFNLSPQNIFKRDYYGRTTIL